jgi:POT family proton-dependent oligopeptide transporter
MVGVAYALHFIKQVGWAAGFASVFLPLSLHWIIMSSNKDEVKRVVALILVFAVVIFYWMSFHQNGLTLTLFARDYTVKQVGPFTNLFFTLWSILAVIGTIAGAIVSLRNNISSNARIAGIVLLLVSLSAAILFYRNFSASNSISPEIFQSFNPLFIVALTFPVMGVFSWLNKKGKEPSTPKKIGIGMIIAAIGFLVVLIASLDLVSPKLLGGTPVPEDGGYRRIGSSQATLS